MSTLQHRYLEWILSRTTLDVNFQDIDGRTTLLLAVTIKNLEMVEMLLVSNYLALNAF